MVVEIENARDKVERLSLDLKRNEKGNEMKEKRRYQVGNVGRMGGGEMGEGGGGKRKEKRWGKGRNIQSF